MPMARLLKAVQIVNRGGCRHDVNVPWLFLIERHQVIPAKEHKLPRAEFLIKIAGQKKRILAHQRQECPKPISAEPICVHTRSSRQAKVKIVVQMRERVAQQRGSPKQMRMRLDSPRASDEIVRRPVHKSITGRVSPELAFV